MSEHIGISLFCTLVGFARGVGVGVPLRLLAVYSRRAGAMVSPVIAGAATFPIACRRAAESLGLTKVQTFFRIVLPGALPQIFTGLKVALALSWAVAVAAELVGAQSGLGFMIWDATLLFRIPVVFIGIALIGVIGLALNLTLNFIEHKVAHWRGR